MTLKVCRPLKCSKNSSALKKLKSNSSCHSSNRIRLAFHFKAQVNSSLHQMASPDKSRTTMSTPFKSSTWSSWKISTTFYSRQSKQRCFRLWTLAAKFSGAGETTNTYKESKVPFLSSGISGTGNCSSAKNGFQQLNSPSWGW
jgi:hypothetical protein